MNGEEKKPKQQVEEPGKPRYGAEHEEKKPHYGAEQEGKKPREAAPKGEEQRKPMPEESRKHNGQ